MAYEKGELYDRLKRNPKSLLREVDGILEVWETQEGSMSNEAFSAISQLSEYQTSPFVKIVPKVVSSIQSREINYVDAYRLLSQVAANEPHRPPIFNVTEEAWVYLHTNDNMARSEKGYFGTYLKEAILSPLTVVYVDDLPTDMIKRMARQIPAAGQDPILNSSKQLDYLDDLLCVEKNFNIVIEYGEAEVQ
jgi:hypothetical protein